MKLSTIKKHLLILGTSLLTLLANQAKAGTVYLFQFSPNSVTKERDPYYIAKYGNDDTTSCVFTSTTEFQVTPESPTNRLLATMSGRHYDTDPQRGDDWGLLDPADPNFEEGNGLFQGYVIKYGLPPKAFGSTESLVTFEDGKTAPASYISFKVRADDTVMFTNVTVTLENLTAIEDTDTAWGGIFTGGNAYPITPVITESERNGVDLRISWPSLTVTSEELEIRIYGLKGADYGNYSTGTITGTIVPPQVPEATSSMLLLVTAFGIACRRKRSQA